MAAVPSAQNSADSWQNESEKDHYFGYYENGAYDVQQELKIAYGNRLDLQIEICSITHRKALEKVFEKYHPQIIINAAAHKHVPLMEHNCVEAIYNNVFGTQNLVELLRGIRSRTLYDGIYR